jgi:hypothetical protein
MPSDTYVPQLLNYKDKRLRGSRHSDEEKFHSDLDRPKSCEMPQRPLKMLRNSADFQAEYRPVTNVESLLKPLLRIAI